MDFDTILNSLESEYLEITSTFDPSSGKAKDKLCQNICAFANNLSGNDQKGYYVIGLDDKGKERTRFRVTDDIKKRIVSIIRSNGDILPLPNVELKADNSAEGDVLIIEVTPSSDTPFRYKKEVYIRSGPTLQKATIEEERRLSERNDLSRLPYELKPCSNSGLTDIDLHSFENYLSAAVSEKTLNENNRPVEQKLASLRFWNLNQNTVTNLGIWVLGQNIRFFFHSFYVQYVKFKGTDVTSDVIEKKEISGDIYSLIKSLETLSETLSTEVPVENNGFNYGYKPRYLLSVLRELIINAIVHRDYEVNSPIKFYIFSDRILIENPGGYIGGAGKKPPLTNQYRNPNLAAVLKTYGFMEQFGSGISKCMKLCEENGNRLEFDTSKHESFSATIYSNLPQAADLKSEKKTVPSVAFFNNKGGVGKTTLLYHIAWMLCKMDYNVLVADLDPQCNTTSMFLDDDTLEQVLGDHYNANEGQPAKNIFQVFSQIEKGTGDILEIEPVKVNPDNFSQLELIPGHLGLSKFEDRLSNAWSDSLNEREDAFRVISAFYRVLQNTARKCRSDIILIDVAPNLGALNRCVLLSAEAYVIPMASDLFSLQGLKNLGATFKDWNKQWKRRIEIAEDAKISLKDHLPKGNPYPLGYVLMQHNIRNSKPVKAYQKWADKIPFYFANHILNLSESDPNFEKDHCLAQIKNYMSLMPMAQEARKPVFDLTAADGAIGAHFNSVKDAEKDFRSLTDKILKKYPNANFDKHE